MECSVRRVLAACPLAVSATGLRVSGQEIDYHWIGRRRCFNTPV